MTSLSALGRYELLDPEGRPHFFESLWRDRPLVLAFVRHFGCLLCAEAVSELNQVRGDIERRGARLAVVGHGNPQHARWFGERMDFRAGLFTDPSRGLYRALGMAHGLGTTLNLAAARHALRALRSGHRQHSTQGDPWQQGGTLVVRRGGELVWQHRSRAAGDHPGVATVLAQLDRA